MLPLSRQASRKTLTNWVVLPILFFGCMILKQASLMSLHSNSTISSSVEQSNSGNLCLQLPSIPSSYMETTRFSPLAQASKNQNEERSQLRYLQSAQEGERLFARSKARLLSQYGLIDCLILVWSLGPNTKNLRIWTPIKDRFKDTTQGNLNFSILANEPSNHLAAKPNLFLTILTRPSSMCGSSNSRDTFGMVKKSSRR